jgi:ABC-type lipoprotein export system ATPase subunit
MRNPKLWERIQEVLELTGLQDRARKPVKQFRSGMKRRLNFACSILHSPKVPLLDEPTVGVDPQCRVRLLDLVRARSERELACYTTHYMEKPRRCAIVWRSWTTARSSRRARRHSSGRCWAERDRRRLWLDTFCRGLSAINEAPRR